MSSTSNRTSPTRLRQIALVAEDLKKAEYLLTKVIGTEVIFVDPGVGKWGLENILVAIGGDIIEVVSPTQPGTTAGRLLSKRGGDGGYMIIMQNSDAPARRSYIESHGLSKVIYSHEHDDSVCIQYHPKGIKGRAESPLRRFLREHWDRSVDVLLVGGMMPELDSHLPTPAHPDPLNSRFSPWHACGKDYASYSAGMRRHADLQLVGVTCRLAPGDADIEGAAKQWEEIFGVPRRRDVLAFTNARMDFVKGIEGEKEGLVSVRIAVKREETMKGILDRAEEEGVCGDGWINMAGLRWHFVLAGGEGGKSRL